VVLLLLACTAPALAEEMGMLPREVDRSIDIARERKARAIIVYGAGEESGLALARRVQQAVTDVTGVKLEIAASSLRSRRTST